MFLPGGRWNSQLYIIVNIINMLADVIAQWQMEWPLQGGVHYQLAYVITRWQMDVHG